jgi:hypothetical protein
MSLAHLVQGALSRVPRLFRLAIKHSAHYKAAAKLFTSHCRLL